MLHPRNIQRARRSRSTLAQIVLDGARAAFQSPPCRFTTRQIPVSWHIMGFIIHEFAKVPCLSPEYQHQSNAMTLVRYLVPEGQFISRGTAVALLENWWACFEVVSNAPGKIAKNLFDSVPGITLSVDTPITLFFYEPEDLPKEGSLFDARVVSVKRQKPRSNHAS